VHKYKVILIKQHCLAKRITFNQMS